LASGKDGDARISSPAESAEIRELSLEEVLESYEQPINEEQAWAVCFQCCRKLLIGLRHRSSCTETARSPEKTIHLVQSMGAAIYRALDWGLDDSEERELSPQLEQLIEFMVGSSESKHCGSNAAKDEGYSGQDEDEEEEEEGAVHGFHTVHQLMALCARRLANPALAPEHYQAVCRALFLETLELQTFLSRIRETEEPQEDSSTAELDTLHGARLWVQLMKELRQGVKLKKMLMQDIRSRKYKLRKVVVDGNIPTCVKRNAHELILDSIRSRPPLKPVSERSLPPPQRQQTLHDRVLAEVRQDHKLRPVEPSSSERSFGSLPCLAHTCQCDIKSTSCIDLSITGAGSRPLSHTRVLLKAPTLAEMEEMSIRVESSPTPLKRDRSFSEHHLEELRGEVMSEAWPLTGERPRSHTLTGVGPPHVYQVAYIIVNKDPRRLLCLPHTQEEFSHPVDSLALTVDEVINVRRILFKAEMEKYMQNKELCNNLKKGKLCCCCRVKFPLFSWPSTCLLCKRSRSAKSHKSLCALSPDTLHVEEEFPHLYAAGVCSDCTKFVADVISSSRRSLDIINNTPKRNKRTTSTHPHPTSQPHAFCRDVDHM
uniref:Spire-type actin nucleation factor 2 n=1 Tax=Sinocyclocheilus anshuiensis TaxID=1608454 RepID=A0A671RTK6_9TELE